MIRPRGEFLTVDAVADRLDVRPEHVRALIRRCELPAVNVNPNPLSQKRMYRISETGLQAFLDARRVSPPPPPPRRRRRDYERIV